MSTTKEMIEEATDTADTVDSTIEIKAGDLLSTGSTLLNLRLSGNPYGGFMKGKYFFMVGDSTSGKTFLSMTCFAEATLNKHFKNYRLIYDNGEDGMLMNVDKLFNEEVADRIEPPATADGRPVFSDTAENFYFHLDDAIYAAGWDSKRKRPSDVDDPRPFIYVLDSENNLDSEASDKKFHQHKEAARKKQRTEPSGATGEKDEKVAGSYGMDKAKLHSEQIRKAMKGLRKTGSILIILSQTRINVSGYGAKKTRSGGEALRFYATAEVWSSVAEPIWKKVGVKDRKVGTKIRLETKKNRITGKLGDVEIDIYPSFGIDDLGTCVDYLVEEKYWNTTGQKIDAKGLGVVGTRDKVIRFVERHNLEAKLQELCGQCWHQIEEASALKRKSRYARDPEA